jgi:hypothetical protein
MNGRLMQNTKKSLKRAALERQINGRESTVNRALDGSTYLG